MATPSSTGGGWIFATADGAPFNDNSRQYFSRWYIDGEIVSTSNVRDTEWHLYTLTGVNLSSWSGFYM